MLSKSKNVLKVVAMTLFSVAAVLFACYDTGGIDNPLNISKSQTATYTLMTNGNPITGGTVSPAGTSIYGAGTSVVITAHAANGYEFVSWTGTGVANANNATTTVSMCENRSVIANFAEHKSVGIGGYDFFGSGGNFNFVPTVTKRDHSGHGAEIRASALNAGGNIEDVAWHWDNGNTRRGDNAKKFNELVISDKDSNEWEWVSGGYGTQTNTVKTVPPPDYKTEFSCGFGGCGFWRDGEDTRWYPRQVERRCGR